MSRLAVAFHCGWSVLEFHTFASHESPSTCVFGFQLEGRMEALYHIGYQILEEIVVTDHAASFGSILVFHIACLIDTFEYTSVSCKVTWVALVKLREAMFREMKHAQIVSPSNKAVRRHPEIRQQGGKRHQSAALTFH